MLRNGNRETCDAAADSSAVMSGATERPIEVDAGFRRILEAHKVSLAVNLVPGGLLLVGTAPGGPFSVETFALGQDEPSSRIWGLAADHDRLVVADTFGITLYANSPMLAARHPERPGRYDAYFTPRLRFFTGACMVHDIAIAASNLVVANTAFSAVCAIDGRASFDPIWHPGFISAVLPEDRCHLNGLAVEDGALRYVTTFGAFDSPGGWRRRALDGGLLIDVARDRPLCEGLVVPHSPRLFGGRLLVLESGHGTVVEVDRGSGRRRVMAELPGFTRGMVQHEGVLFVGMSRVRPTSEGFPLPVAARGEAMVCGIAALDAASGALLGMLRFTGGAVEVFDIAVLPGIACAGLADMSRPDTPYILDSRAGTYWMQPAPQRPSDPH